VVSADEAARAADMSIPTVRLSLEGRMLRAELLKAQEQAAESAAAHVAPPAHTHIAAANAEQRVNSTGGDDGGVLRVSSTAKEVPGTANGKENADDDEELMGWAGF
jgi:hypothetical protein